MRPPEAFLEQPVRSLQTMLRVLSEDDRRLPTVVPDGIYGPSTMQAVSAFQRREGLPVNGVADQLTWERLVYAYEPALIRVEQAESIEIIMDPGEVFRRNDSNPYIYLMQSILLQLAQEHPTISPPSHNGVIDAATSESIAGFQALAGLPITGELDKITWKHLSRHFTAYAQHKKMQSEAYAL